MWGWLLLGTHVFSAPAAVTMIFEIFSRVGSPTAEDAAYFASLPLWSTQLPQFPAQPLSRTIARKITQSCADLLQGLFRVSPRTRLAARDVTERLPKAWYAQPASSGTDGVASPVFAPTVAEPDVATAASAGAPASGCASGAAPAPEPAGLALFSIASAASGNHADNTAALKMTLKQGPSGSTDFQGGRARFSLLVGNIGTDVLDWLCNGLEAMDDSAWGFGPEAEGKDRKVENGCKLEIAVHLLKTNKSSKLSLNGLACYHPAPVAWRAWVLAFKERNKDALDYMQDGKRAAAVSLRLGSDRFRSIPFRCPEPGPKSRDQMLQGARASWSTPAFGAGRERQATRGRPRSIGHPGCLNLQ